MPNRGWTADYFELLKAPAAVADRGPTVRLALVADHATQQLGAVLRTLLAEQGLQASIYEAPFDAGELEAFDPSSALHTFAPDFVIVSSATQALRSRHFQAGDDRASFAQRSLHATCSLWDALTAGKSTRVIQGTVPAPLERHFGSYGLGLPDSLSAACFDLNAGLIARARGREDVLIADVAQAAAEVGLHSWFDERLWAVAKAPCALPQIPRMAAVFADVILAALGRQIKCVVVDLDNTLWDGIVAEDGLEGISIGEIADGAPFAQFQSFLKELVRRGIFLAACSKNDEALARRVVAEHPEMLLRESDFAVFVANWQDKAENIRTIRERLNIGFDSMVFLDDSSFERNLVRNLLPEVTVPELPEEPAEYVATLCRLNLFETASHSAIDGQRARLAGEEARRDEEKRRFGSIDEYLASLEMEAEIRPFEELSLPRIVQLAQRSNQFNLTTRRLSVADCRELMATPERHLPFTISLRDRMGDFGLIAILVMRFESDSAHVDDYMMSCRVLLRGVEELTVNAIVDAARRRHCRWVRGLYRPTAKNGMVKELYGRLGFELEATEAGEVTRWRLDVTGWRDRTTHVRPSPGSILLASSGFAIPH